MAQVSGLGMMTAAGEAGGTVGEGLLGVGCQAGCPA